jgi:hypothetical protein
MDGNATAEAFITHQWLPDSPKTPAHGGTGGTLVGKPLFNETIRYRRGVVGCSLGYFTVTGCIPQPWLAPAGPRGYRRNQSKYQFATDNLLVSWN